MLEKDFEFEAEQEGKDQPKFTCKEQRSQTS